MSCLFKLMIIFNQKCFDKILSKALYVTIFKNIFISFSCGLKLALLKYYCVLVVLH